MKAIVILSITLAAAGCPTHVKAETSAVVINEVMANPLDEDTGEFVELYNRGDVPIDLSGWRLADAADTNDIILDFVGLHQLVFIAAFVLDVRLCHFLNLSLFLTLATYRVQA